MRRYLNRYASLLDGVYKISRWALGIIFIYTGGIKLLDPESFAVLIDAFGIVPDELLMTVAIGLPAMELAAGAGLLFDIEGSLSVIAALLIVFIAILGYGIWMGLDIDCGCFGPEDPEAKAFHGLRPAVRRLFQPGHGLWLGRLEDVGRRGRYRAARGHQEAL